jgi:hypothetical protein
MRFHTGALGFVAAGFAGCAGGQLASSTTDDLSGLTLPLLTDGGVRLAVAGKVGERDATVLFDSTRELSSASQGCFEGSPALVSMVKLEPLRGGTVELPGATLSGLTLGGIGYRDIEVALETETGCTVRLGLELLKPYALRYRPEPAQVTILRSLHDADLEGLRRLPGVNVLKMEKAHGHEWPLLVTRANQGPGHIIATLVVATAEHRSELSASVLEGGSPKSLEQMARLLGEPPSSVAVEKHSAVFVETLELSPRLNVGPLWVSASPWSPSTTAQGTLGGDAWGSFNMTLDFGKGAMVVHSRRASAAPVSKESPERRLVDRFVKWLEERKPVEEPELPEP